MQFCEREGLETPTDVTLNSVLHPTWQHSPFLEFDKAEYNFFFLAPLNATACRCECVPEAGRLQTSRLRLGPLQTLSMHISTLRGERQLTLLDS